MRTHEVMIVVTRGAEFLVLLRSPERRGYWHLPAGGVEVGETAAEAAARDLELGYEAASGRMRVDSFAAGAPPGWEPVLDEEHTEYRWCSTRDALDLLAYDEPRKAVRQVARQLEVTT
ncbi:MAG: NUDIX domain-containing protein [Actinobacteria bacterium]|nr:MAG: NUDIX domain-containing protein [Actinomycetota bacterium]